MFRHYFLYLFCLIFIMPTCLYTYLFSITCLLIWLSLFFVLRLLRLFSFLDFSGFGVIWGVGLLRNLGKSVVSLPRFIIKDRNPVRSGFRYVLRFDRLPTTTAIIYRLANGLGVFSRLLHGARSGPVIYTG